MNISLNEGKGYFNKIKSKKQFPYLNENIETDVVIIGGGVTGSLCAYYLSQNNIPCVVIDKSRISMDSTCISTSLLQYELDDNIESLEKILPIDKIEKVYKLSLQALKDIGEIVEKYGNHCEYGKRDCLLYTDVESEASQLIYEYEKRKQMKLDVELISQANNPFEFNITAGVYSKMGGAVINPYKFTQMLINIAEKNGAKIFENTEAMEIITEKDKTIVATKFDNYIKCKKVIVATGYSTEGILEKQYGEKSVTFNIVTKPIKNFKGWHNQALIRDNENIYHYLRVTDDNRIIIGGEDISLKKYSSNKKIEDKKYKSLLNHLKKMFPSLKKDLEVEFSYCGIFDSTKDNIGIIGEDTKNKNIWYCFGYGANGILFSTTGAKMLAEKYLGVNNKDLELFTPNRNC